MSKQIKIGNIKIGGGAPISIQSMTKTDTKDEKGTVCQIKELEKEGCEIVRAAIKDIASANALKKIKNKVKIPIVCDIHFDYRLALACIKNGADKIRLNPGNIYKENEVKEIARACKKAKIPIRVGANSGSLRITHHASRITNMVKSVLDYIKMLEKFDFYDIIVSLKTSSVIDTIKAYKLFSKKSKYPLHLGVTAAGSLENGLIKSSIGIGALLLDGIGDTIRVSLTADPREEVKAAKNILQSLNLRHFSPEIISCPTCGRCQVDLQKIVKEIESLITKDKRLTTCGAFSVAIMGCEVNGPGEAKDADIGAAFGKGKAALFKKGKIIKTIKEKDVIKTLLGEIRKR